jgi:paired amphipathic helix protein Sin3a
MITFQLLSKDGSSLDDAEVLSGRWQAYVEGFVSDAETPGVPAAKVRRPFLRRYVGSTSIDTTSRFYLYLYLYLSLAPPTHYRNRSLPASTTATTAAGSGSGAGAGVGAGAAGTRAGGAGAEQDFYARGGLEIKVCVRTYRLFYVSRTEDVLWRTPPAAETERANARDAARDAARMRWLEKFTFTTAGRSSLAGGVGVGGGGGGVTSTPSEVTGLE